MIYPWMLPPELVGLLGPIHGLPDETPPLPAVGLLEPTVWPSPAPKEPPSGPRYNVVTHGGSTVIGPGAINGAPSVRLGLPEPRRGRVG